MRSRFQQLAAALVTVALAGCPGDDTGSAPEPETLARAEGWTYEPDPAQDVFGDLRPADATCDPDMGITVEVQTQALEISTDACDFATVRQASLAPVATGDTIQIRVEHEELTADPPAEAYLALALDGDIVWEQTLPIPSDPATLEPDVVAERDYDAGADLQFHVHNHGVNVYALLSLSVAPAD